MTHSHAGGNGHTHHPEQIVQAAKSVQALLATMLRPVALDERQDGLPRFWPSSLEAAVMRRILRQMSKDYGIDLPPEATP